MVDPAAALLAAQLNLSHAVQQVYLLRGQRVFTIRVAGYGAN